MAAGADLYTAMREVQVPEHLDVGEGYGKTSWNVRAIWEMYAGWFQHRSTTELYGVAPHSIAGDVVHAAGADALVEAARAHTALGRPVQALHLTDLVLAAEPATTGARAAAHRCTRSTAGRHRELLGEGLAHQIDQRTEDARMNSLTFDYTGANVLVTGGTAGIGNGIAQAFAKAGAAVTITGTRASAADYDDDLSAFTYHQCQVRDTDSVDALAASLGDLDILINNAGGPYPAGDEYDPEGYVASVTQNMFGPMRLTMKCYDRLKSSNAPGGASVVNIVSMSAFRSAVFVPGYASSKMGLIALTMNLARRWANDGIRVNAVAPGLIDTRMTHPRWASPKSWTSRSDSHAARPAGHTAGLRRCGVVLCTDAASYITGTSIAVDGGYLTV